MLWCQTNLDYSYAPSVGVIVSYDLILCDICGDEVYREFSDEPNSGQEELKNHQFLCGSSVWEFLNEATVELTWNYCYTRAVQGPSYL